MSSIDDFLKTLGLGYDELTEDERNTYHTWLEQLETNSLTIEDIRRHVKTMRQAVDVELAKHDNPRNQDRYLKARLQNYILLEAFLDTPERARRAFDKQIKSRQHRVNPMQAS